MRLDVRVEQRAECDARAIDVVKLRQVQLDVARAGERRPPAPASAPAHDRLWIEPDLVQRVAAARARRAMSIGCIVARFSVAASRSRVCVARSARSARAAAGFATRSGSVGATGLDGRICVDRTVAAHRPILTDTGGNRRQLAWRSSLHWTRRAARED